MKIIIAKHIAFCSGVKRAINIAKKSLKKDPRPIQFLGKLIHNEKVIEELKKKGGMFLSDLKQVRKGTLIPRTHGVSFDVKKLERKKILVKDTTCPLVKRAQDRAKFLFNQGYQVVIIGDRNHPETKAIKARTKNQAIVIEGQSQAKNLTNLKKIGVVCQTTQNLKKVNKLLKILKQKSNQLKWRNTLCPEVLSRQQELYQILKRTEGVLVIGSRHSANTKRLVDIVKKSKKPAWWINSSKGLKKREFKNFSTLGVVSGTSTPNWIIKDVLDKLRAFQ